MAQYIKMAPPHLVLLYLIEQEVRITMKRDRRLTSQILLYVRGGETSKGKESRKGEDQVKDNPVSEGDQKWLILLRYLWE